MSSDNKKDSKDGIVSKNLPAVVIALLASGTSPCWVDFFRIKNQDNPLKNKKVLTLSALFYVASEFSPCGAMGDAEIRENARMDLNSLDFPRDGGNDKYVIKFEYLRKTTNRNFAGWYWFHPDHPSELIYKGNLKDGQSKLIQWFQPIGA